MSTSTSANPHNAPNERIENTIRRRRMSAITFLLFGLLLIISGSLLASFDSQRFSVSFIVFGMIGILFAFIYWISAEKIMIALRKLNAHRVRQFQTDGCNVDSMNDGNIHSSRSGLPSYEQSVEPRADMPPPYNEVIKLKSSHEVPINSISLSVDQGTSTNSTISLK